MCLLRIYRTWCPEPQRNTIMSGTVSILQQFANGLKSRSEETRAKAAKDLQHYVTMELREVSAANNFSSSLRWV